MQKLLTLSQLKDKAALGDLDKTLSFKLLLRSAISLLVSGIEQDNVDQSYILLMRGLSIFIEILPSLKDFNPNDTLYLSNKASLVPSALDKLETTKLTISKRSPDDLYADSLLNLIHSNAQVLILDLRKLEDFISSHINCSASSNANIINIEPSWVTHIVSDAEIETSFKSFGYNPKTSQLFQKRFTVEHLVLVSYSHHTPELTILTKALIANRRISARPLILQDGFPAWLNFVSKKFPSNMNNYIQSGDSGMIDSSTIASKIQSLDIQTLPKDRYNLVDSPAEFVTRNSVKRKESRIFEKSDRSSLLLDAYSPPNSKFDDPFLYFKKQPANLIDADSNAFQNTDANSNNDLDRFQQMFPAISGDIDNTELISYPDLDAQSSASAHFAQRYPDISELSFSNKNNRSNESLSTYRSSIDDPKPMVPPLRPNTKPMNSAGTPINAVNPITASPISQPMNARNLPQPPAQAGSLIDRSTMNQPIINPAPPNRPLTGTTQNSNAYQSYQPPSIPQPTNMQYSSTWNPQNQTNNFQQSFNNLQNNGQKSHIFQQPSLGPMNYQTYNNGQMLPPVIPNNRPNYRPLPMPSMPQSLGPSVPMAGPRFDQKVQNPPKISQNQPIAYTKISEIHPPPLPRKPVVQVQLQSHLHSRIGMAGLKNLGNTCFMNSIIQCLNATVPLSRYFLDGSYRRHVARGNKMGSGGVIADCYALLIKNIWNAQESTITPLQFKETVGSRHPSFQGNEQQDSQEFLAFLLDALHEDLNLSRNRPKSGPNPEIDSENIADHILQDLEWEKYKSKNWSIIVDMCQGLLRSKLQCLVCGKTSTTFNPFMYLTLPIPSKNKAGKVGGPVYIQECLNSFMQREILDGNDAWHCPRCKKAQKASKILSIARLPLVLMIHLKRFSFSGPFRDKIDTYVEFPIQSLDLTYCVANQSEQFVYDLYATSSHFGGLNGGHYTAQAKNGHQNQWYDFNDSRITPIEEKNVKSSAAYLLFYTKVSGSQQMSYNWWSNDKP